MSDHLLDAVVAANREGRRRGIYSVCSAHPLVLEAAFLQARQDASPLLIEATCNQVNQEGGYTGQTPEDFRDRVLAIAGECGFDPARLILGGDHLGPSPWQSQPAEAAMAKAEALVAAYAAAGFTKLHLDASMACADDPPALDDAQVAARAARLCRAAEQAAGERRGELRYVIGTEVPTPGGAHEHLDGVAVTSTQDLERTLATHRTVFDEHDLADAWSRVRGVVVQPGVEFGHSEVVDFVPDAARELSRAIAAWPNIVFEAHSTDYQTAAAYAELVAGHFAILKVGPALTFALREALFALEAIAIEAPGVEAPPLAASVEQAMLENPGYWQAYYQGDAEQQRFARRYSLSDRIRYYWNRPEVAANLAALFTTLSSKPLPLPLISQYLPEGYRAIREGRLAAEPRALVQHHVQQVLAAYARACLPETR
ncbi:D-tagatose-bisphosphate aldolase, class II, non-catalytic subunit [Halomonas sp. HP20-15]|uniref:D-tagatose-bisphosphate aldolase, class II, non-catalytic subunit n=1 Tax=Halomonas sp. HP20-15 TaxID=3085901 RepID=UPI002981AF47|nr:D-tagatose-bisphosphate aldolase, class II, non-catalytic subunit [Halomonas sp. HP20-15]MDW5378772.1 D-tagatose-bisphosphate aldolase, class II, non-catalytic subunit [Halomonas sp. HP20-15]